MTTLFDPTDLVLLEHRNRLHQDLGRDLHVEVARISSHQDRRLPRQDRQDRQDRRIARGGRPSR